MYDDYKVVKRRKEERGRRKIQHLIEEDMFNTDTKYRCGSTSISGWSARFFFGQKNR